MRSSGQTSNRTLSSHNTGVGGTDQFIGAAENADLDWLRSRLTPHLWKTYSEPLWLTRDRKGRSQFRRVRRLMRVFTPQTEKGGQAAVGHAAYRDRTRSHDDDAGRTRSPHPRINLNNSHSH